jgi:hypothetical protein
VSVSQPLSCCRAATLPQQVLIVPPRVFARWTCRVHYRAHNSSTLVLLLSPVFLHDEFHCYLYTHLRLRLPSGLFSSGFLTKTLHVFLFFPTRVIHVCRTHLVSNNATDNCCALLRYRVIQKEGTLPRVHTEIICRY